MEAGKASQMQRVGALHLVLQKPVVSVHGAMLVEVKKIFGLLLKPAVNKKPPKKDIDPAPLSASQGPFGGQMSNKAAKAPDFQVVNIKIRTRMNRTLHQDPVRVQVKVGRWEKARQQEHIAEAFTAKFIFWLFSWSSQGVFFIKF